MTRINYWQMPLRAYSDNRTFTTYMFIGRPGTLRFIMGLPRRCKSLIKCSNGNRNLLQKQTVLKNVKLTLLHSKKRTVVTGTYYQQIYSKEIRLTKDEQTPPRTVPDRYGVVNGSGIIKERQECGLSTSKLCI